MIIKNFVLSFFFAIFFSMYEMVLLFPLVSSFFKMYYFFQYSIFYLSVLKYNKLFALFILQIYNLTTLEIKRKKKKKKL